MVEAIGDKRLYIKRETERETEREREKEGEREREKERECVCACMLFYNTKLWPQFYISGLTWEQEWLRSVCASCNMTKSSFFAYHLRWVYIPKTHTGLQKIQKKKKKKKYPATSCGGVL